MRIKDIEFLGAIFDQDGVIADSLGIRFRAFSEVFKKFGITVTRDELKSEWGRGAKQIIKDIIEKNGLKADAEKLTEEEEREYLRLAPSELKALPGAVELIRALHGLVPIAVASGAMRRGVDLTLRACGVKKYMSATVSADEVRRTKPFPDLFLKAAKEINVEPSKCVVFEDGTKGTVAGKRAGMKVIAVATGDETREELWKEKPDMLLGSLNEALNLMKKTKLCFLIGNPVEHSLSPLMQNTAFRIMGLDWHYQALKVEKLGEIIPKLRELAAGFNVTIPHKIRVIEYLDELEPLAEEIGAVNTVINKKGKLIGYNTDAEGFGAVLKDEKINVRGIKVVLLGAGGAARAIALWLKKAGAEVIIANRTEAKGKKLARDVGCTFGPIQKADMFVNATSVGMHPRTGESPLSAKFIEPGTIIYDIIYNPVKTKLIRGAKAKGARTIDGVRMLVEQGALSFRLWTGKEAPKKEMEKAVRDALGN